MCSFLSPNCPVTPISYDTDVHLKHFYQLSPSFNKFHQLLPTFTTSWQLSYYFLPTLHLFTTFHEISYLPSFVTNFCILFTIFFTIFNHILLPSTNFFQLLTIFYQYFISPTNFNAM